jgi:hypothetical protein
MKPIKFTLKRSDVKLRRLLPTSLVAQRPHRDRKTYDRKAFSIDLN